MLNIIMAEALDKLISEKLREDLDPNFKMMLNKVQYFNEFRTIHLNCGRATGKTEYINRNSGKHDVIIVLNEFAKKFYSPNKNLFTVNELKHVYFNTEQIDIVWVDEPSLSLKEKPKSVIYNTFKRYDPLFVFLGE